MNGLTILEMAANVREERRLLDEKCTTLKQIGVEEWVSFSMAAEEATAIAEDGMRNAYRLLQRLRGLACDQQSKLPPNVGNQRGA